MLLRLITNLESYYVTRPIPTETCSLVSKHYIEMALPCILYVTWDLICKSAVAPIGEVVQFDKHPTSAIVFVIYGESEEYNM